MECAVPSPKSQSKDGVMHPEGVAVAVEEKDIEEPGAPVDGTAAVQVIVQDVPPLAMARECPPPPEIAVALERFKT